MRKILAALLVLLLIGGCAAKEPQEKAPEFSYEDTAGNTWALAQQQGKIVVLYFWLGSCGVCINKLPDLADLQKQLPEDAVLLTLNANDSKGKIEELTGDLGLTVLVNARASFDDYGVAYVPTTVFIDRNGGIRETIVGSVPNQQLLKILNDLR